jgi:hypothetical protein
VGVLPLPHPGLLRRCFEFASGSDIYRKRQKINRIKKDGAAYHGKPLTTGGIHSDFRDDVG